MAGLTFAQGQRNETTDLREFEFVCEFRLSMERGRLDGRMASEGVRRRVTIYWIEPDVFREGPSFIHCVDLIFTPDSVAYWLQPGARRGTISLQANEGEPLLPSGRSVDSIVRSALAIVRRVATQDDGTDASLEVGRFFRDSRDRGEHAYKVPNRTSADGNDPPAAADADVELLNSWPAGREYVKERRQDGAVVWQIKKVLPSVLVASVAIKPTTGAPTVDRADLFDPNTLGRSPLTPEPYKAYWSFDAALSELAEAADQVAASRTLCARFDSCLNDSNAPLEVRRGLYRLWFKAALMTGDMGCVRTCMERGVAGVREDTRFGSYWGLLELARCSGEIQSQFPHEPQEWLRPLVAEGVRHAGSNAGYCLGRLMPLIGMNQWFIFGEFFLHEIRSQGLLEVSALRDMTVRLKATQLARGWRTEDPCESSPRIREYLARIDDEPPKGPLDMETLRHVLEGGLTTACDGDDPQARQRVIDEVVRSLRLIVGGGPFQGDSDRLMKAVERFSQRFRQVFGSVESIGPVLATFLGLSFCDLSTAEDRDALLAQLARQSAELQAQVNEALGEGGLNSLMAPQDVADVFRRHEASFSEYVNDPLWPTHRFPLTPGEESVLTGNMTSFLLRQKPLFDDVAQKFRYGGASQELKNALIRVVSNVALRYLAETGAIRRPPYPGVSCQHQGGQGFVVRIEGPFYEEERRPKERFKAMKYFHLGRRLEGVVLRERELMSKIEAQEVDR
ncbi:MAG TPA: hypothetical protein VLI39_12640 [Sedimentisphaerales bacterium]|nr:hypothetical protein [Sedimentisphaerales bacterium]